MTRREMTTEEFDEYFDNGGDITPFVDESKIRFPNRERGGRRVNFTMPEWLIEELDAQARHLAISRQAVAVTWLAERADIERGRRLAV